jgi:hypothetical protein
MLSLMAVLLFLSLLFPHPHPPRAPDHAALEETLIAQLNDCVWPRDRIPIGDSPPEFLDFLHDSEFIQIENQSVTIKKPRKSLFCRILSYTDRHPDVSGLVVLLALGISVYAFVVYQRAKASALVPGIIERLRGSENRMCFVDDMRRHVAAQGGSGWCTWRFVVSMVNRSANVRRMEVKYSKPFWFFVGDD